MFINLEGLKALIERTETRAIAKGHIDDNDVSELLFTVKRIANA